MFVYTFENIVLIKNLKHSDSVKSKHQKKIDRIKNGIFSDLDYSEFKYTHPPKNESLQTYSELKNLQRLPEDKNFVVENDDVEDVFEKVCERNGVEFPKKMVEKI